MQMAAVASPHIESVILRFVESNAHRPPTAAVICAALVGSVGSAARDYHDAASFGALSNYTREQVSDVLRGLIRGRRLRADRGGIVILRPPTDTAPTITTPRDASAPRAPLIRTIINDDGIEPRGSSRAGASLAERAVNVPLPSPGPGATAGVKRAREEAARASPATLHKRVAAAVVAPQGHRMMTATHVPAQAAALNKVMPAAPAAAVSAVAASSTRTSVPSVGLHDDLAGMEDILLADDFELPRAGTPAPPPPPTAVARAPARSPVDDIAALLLGSPPREPERTYAAAAPAPADGDEDVDLSSLSEEQRAVYDFVMQGKSVFFTGSAGTGKSHLLRIIIAGLKAAQRAAGKSDSVYITAPTGIAACNIGGTTLHSFAGIGQGNKTGMELAADLERSHGAAAKRWKAAAVLVVDEVSMLDGFTFDKLELIARRVRHTDRPFGGIQVVLAGDFLQLPPVASRRDAAPAASGRGRGFSRGGRGGGSRAPHPTSIAAATAAAAAGDTDMRFCFEADCWDKVLDAEIALTRVYRQKDPAFISLLNELRMGRVSAESERTLKSCGAVVEDMEKRFGIKPTRIFARNSEVDSTNDTELARCAGPKFEYDARDEGMDPHLSALVSSCPAPARLELKRTAQVMLLKNLDSERGLVNGARGIVVDFQRNPEGGWPPMLPVVSFERGGDAPVQVTVDVATWSTELGSAVVAQRSQVPLKLAYALSIHKSQGMGISLLEVSLTNIFEYGQAYVALSRAVALDRMRVRGFTRKCAKAHPRVLEYYQRLRAKGTRLVPALAAARAAKQSAAADEDDGPRL